jgi:hypothetical protein
MAGAARYEQGLVAMRRLLDISPARRIGAALGRALLGESRYPRWRNRLIDRLTREKDLEEECRLLYQNRIENLVEVREPLVLISQIQRSGGTLLRRLIDGQPQCHVHAQEFHIGPEKGVWPTLDLQDGSADAWFWILRGKPPKRAFIRGIGKPARGERFPFLFPPRLQRMIFDKCLSSREITSERDILDCYMTSYFNAWLDNQNLYAGPKKFVVGFMPRMMMRSDNLERFFATYPDGRLIAIIRDPRSWYVSARGHDEKQYGAVEAAMHLWGLSARSMIEAKEQYGDDVYLLSFEDLLSNTEKTMRSLAAYLDIDFTPGLLTPTFNGFRIKANTSYDMQSRDVDTEPLHRHKRMLTESEIGYIEQRALPLYERVIELKTCP